MIRVDRPVGDTDVGRINAARVAAHVIRHLRRSKDVPVVEFLDRAVHVGPPLADWMPG